MNLIQKYVYAGYKKPKRTNGKVFSLSNFKKPYQAMESYIDGYRLVTIQSWCCHQHHIVFFHGGAYINEPVYLHRRIAKKFTDYGFRVTYFDYPMAPEHTADFTNHWVVKAYRSLLTQYPDDTFHVFGDSAGGGLAVTFLKLLRDLGIQQAPRNCALASPWLDVSLTNPDIEEYLKKDRLLPREGLIYAGRTYAGKLDTKDPYVSPIYGDLRNLGSMIMFFTTNEIFAPDCEKFVRLITQAEGSAIIAHQENSLVHDYLMIPKAPEANEAIQKIVRFFLL
jgi:monoterpene epsilon-lactone hydrolase